MSNIYIQEPPTTGKVLLKTSVGDVEIELWTKEAPKACRNFIQLCMDGYYENTIFHRVVKGFIVQGGDPTGTGLGGESIYGQPFKDEFHSRLRFCRRGLVAMANAGKDDNTSQFFFTLSATPELQNKHTIFGKIVGDTIYNVLKLEETEIDQNERPIYPQKIIKTEILLNPFEDLVPKDQQKTDDETVKETKKRKKSGVKNFKLLSFGEEAEEDEEESTVLNRQFSGKSKSAHDNLEDPKLSKETVQQGGPPRKKVKEDRSSDWESDGNNETEEDKVRRKKEAAEMKKRIIDKLKDKKYTDVKKKKELKIRYDEADEESEDEEEEEEEKKEEKKTERKKEKEDEEEEEEYYLGKDRVDERKRQAEAIRKEIKELKREVQKEKKVKEAVVKKEEEKIKAKESDAMFEFIETQKKYKEALQKIPKKGASREDFTLQMLKKFRNKIQKVKDSNTEEKTSEPNSINENDKNDMNDESWMAHTLNCEDEAAVLAKDANTKADDWFEIYDPRNPLNKRRRGEKSEKSKERRNQYK